MGAVLKVKSWCVVHSLPRWVLPLPPCLSPPLPHSGLVALTVPSAWKPASTPSCAQPRHFSLPPLGWAGHARRPPITQPLRLALTDLAVPPWRWEARPGLAQDVCLVMNEVSRSWPVIRMVPCHCPA